MPWAKHPKVRTFSWCHVPISNGFLIPPQVSPWQAFRGPTLFGTRDSRVGNVQLVPLETSTGPGDLFGQTIATSRDLTGIMVGKRGNSPQQGPDFRLRIDATNYLGNEEKCGELNLLMHPQKYWSIGVSFDPHETNRSPRMGVGN